MAERSSSHKVEADAQESPAEALDNAANGTGAGLSAARRSRLSGTSGTSDGSASAEPEPASAEPLSTPSAPTEEPPAVSSSTAAPDARTDQPDAPPGGGPAASTPDAGAGQPAAAQPATTQPEAAKAAPTSGAPAKRAATKSAVKKAAPVRGGASKDKGGKGKAAMSAVGSGVSRFRNLVGSVVWLVAVLCAAVLALGALFTALDQANENNEIVSWVLDRGRDLVGPFEDVFKAESAKNTLLINWGIAALAYLIVGKIAERIIRP